MNAIVKSTDRYTWDPLRDFDQFFDGYWAPAAGTANSGRAPAVDVTETENEYTLYAELPGVAKDDLEINIQEGTLTINAETKDVHEDNENGRVLRRERRVGKYARSIYFGDDINSDKVVADYADGVLTMTLPKAEAVKPKRIEIKVH